MCWSLFEKIIMVVVALNPLYISNGASPSDLQLYMAGDVDQFDFWWPTTTEEKYRRWSKTEGKLVIPSRDHEFPLGAPPSATITVTSAVLAAPTGTSTTSVVAAPGPSSPTGNPPFDTASRINGFPLSWHWVFHIIMASAIGVLLVPKLKGPPSPTPAPPPLSPKTTILQPTSSTLGFFDFSALTSKPVPVGPTLHPPTISPHGFFDFSALTSKPEPSANRYVVFPPALHQPISPPPAVPTIPPPSTAPPPPPAPPATPQRPTTGSVPPRYNPAAASFSPRGPPNMPPTGQRNHGFPLGFGHNQGYPVQQHYQPGDTRGHANNLPVYRTQEEFQRLYPGNGTRR